MTQKHTPQIEEYNPVDGQFFIVKNKEGRMIAKAFSIQDSRLIAAAPELLEALKALMPIGWDDGTMDHMPGVKLARISIAKATGAA